MKESLVAKAPARPAETGAPLADADLADIFLRPAGEGDMDAVAAIYAHHVLTGRGSFETEPPSAQEMRRRRREVLSRGLPYLVAEMPGGAVVGYAYATLYRQRAAYRHTVENSVYVRPDMARRGIGRRLLKALIVGCESAGFRQMVAVVGDSANLASIRLHEALGFRLVGTLRAVGRKHGLWLDTVFLQRPLGEGDGSPPADE
jgi:L-amino acid N-acyltransferase YncA